MVLTAIARGRIGSGRAMTMITTLIGSVLLGSLPLVAGFWVVVKPRPMLVLVSFARFVVVCISVILCVCVCVCVYLYLCR